MSARLPVLHAVESPSSKGVRAGAQDAQGFAEDGFINEPLLYVFKEKMEAVTPEEKHGLLHKTNVLYAA